MNGTIIKILDNKKLSGDISRAGKKFVLENIDYHKNMAKMEKIMMKQINA